MSFELLTSLHSCLSSITTPYGVAGSLFIAGLIGSTTHCIVMCGPFVVSQTGGLHKISESMLIPYHIGRIITYTFLAILFHSFINLAGLFVPERAFIVAPIIALAGAIFIITAFPSLHNLFPWLSNIRFPLPYSFVNQLTKLNRNLPSWLRIFSMGILLGFIPCGLVTAAILAAASSPDILSAALGMVAFGVGTMPALIAVGLGGKTFFQRYPQIAQRMKRALVICSGLWLFVIAGSLFM